MSALFGALGSLAESYGLARQDVMEQRQREAQAKLEEERMRQEGVRTQLEQTRLKQEQDLASRPMFLGQSYSRAGKEYIRQWDPKQAKVSEIELGPGEESSLQKFVRERMEAGYGRPTEEQVEEEFYKVKPGVKAGVTTPDDDNAAYAWHYFGVKPSGEKAQAGAWRVMLAKGWGPGRAPSGMEARTISATKVAEERTQALRKFIEDNNLTKSNSWGTLLGRYAAQATYLAGREPSDPISNQLTKVSAAVNVLGALPYMQGRQGQKYFMVISQHMPQMHDTPANMYSKTEQMMQIFEQVKRANVTRGPEWTPGGAGPPTTEEAPADVPGAGDESTTPPPTTNIPPAGGGSAPAGGRTPRVTIAPDGKIVVE